MTAHVDTFARDHLPPPEQQPVFQFDRPELQFPAQINCATALLDRWCEGGESGRPCLRDSAGVVWTYAELRDRSNRIARVLVEDMGLVPGNRVLLRGANSPILAACWFGVIKAGGIAVTTMPLLRSKELIEIVTKARISHALCDASLNDDVNVTRQQCATLSNVCCYHSRDANGLEARAAAKSPDFDNVSTAADETCLIAFTSGTTGAPKATMHFHRDVMAACACWPPHLLQATADDVFIGSPPLGFTFGLGGLLLFPLSVGASSVLIEKTAPDHLLDAIERFGASVCVTAPTSYRAMAAHAAGRNLHRLRKCVSAGEPLPVSTRTLWKQATGIDIIDGLGTTELLHIFISHRDNDAKPGATGKPVPGYTACVVDEELQPLPPGRVGRLAVRGPTGCRYLADDRQRDYVQGGWNITGDAYLVDEDGWFVHQARVDDLIISSGYNIAGPEIENTLLAHPAVAECAVVGVRDERRGQIVKAFVVLRAGHDRTPAMIEELQGFVKRTIAPYKYPRAIEFRDALPRTATGKVQRFLLRAEANAAVASLEP